MQQALGAIAPKGRPKWHEYYRDSSANDVDCGKCQVRRVKCDRSLPGCRKCGKRSLQCPGYGTKVKWVQGVASRGKLRGKSIPLRDAPAAALTAHVATSAIFNVHGMHHVSHGLDSFPSSTQNVLVQLAVPPSPSNPCLLETQTPHAPQLLLYFTERVARRLAWIDGPENPWRHIVLPLLEGSETVLTSVLALTAHDMASQYPPDDLWCQRFQTISKGYQNRAIGLLARELNILHRSPDSRSGTNASTPILASAIVLCNAELLKAQEAGWRVHLQAAREVIRAEAGPSFLQQQADRIEEFFLQEFYATSVWAYLTSFHDIDDIVQAPLVGSRDAVFTDMIRIIHQITQAERIKARAQLLQLPQPELIPCTDIHTQLELARRSASCLGQAIQFWSDVDRRAFEHLAWMYFHASLIYSYQALADPAICQTPIKESCDAILMHLHSLSGTGTEIVAQDLVWPLFIAGTECRGSRASQNFIEHQLTNVMRVSRTLDRDRVLSFLKDWWTLAEGECLSWIELARKRAWASDFFLA